MILNDNLNKADAKDKAEDVSDNVNTRRIKQDISLYNTFVTSELALAPTERINTFGL
jgi:hypothetical protein